EQPTSRITPAIVAIVTLRIRDRLLSHHSCALSQSDSFTESPDSTDTRPIDARSRAPRVDGERTRDARDARGCHGLLERRRYGLALPVVARDGEQRRPGAAQHAYEGAGRARRFHDCWQPRKELAPVRLMESIVEGG